MNTESLENLTTEASSNYQNLETMAVEELLDNINKEDDSVAKAVKKVLPTIASLVKAIVPKMREGGRLFYLGAGTSGRLGVVDASECPPTFGVPFDLVIGLIAGGDKAIKKAVELAEDNHEQAWKDLALYKPNSKDTLIGIAASGRTPYVAGGLKSAKENNLLTASIACTNNSLIGEIADFAIEAIVGPEFISGSTRMKAGTAQKMILNMISTSVMIQLGKVKGNKMVDMQLTNHKLEKRAEKMVMEELNITATEAKSLLKQTNSVRKAIELYNKGI